MNQNPRYKKGGIMNTATGNQFIPVPNTPHRHTGQDSLQVDYNDLLNTPAPANPVIYSGAVNADGTKGTPFPTGWTSVKNSTGDYTVTHNLGVGDNEYSYTAIAFSGRQVSPSNQLSNSFEYQTLIPSTGANSDAAILFILTTQANP